jgi:hypothetical protein
VSEPDVDTVKRRGRPRVETPKPGVSASTWLQPNEYDRLVKQANQQGISVSSLVRQLLVLKLR